MNRGFKVLTTVLIIAIGILAASSGYLYAKTTVLEKKLSSADQPVAQPEPAAIAVVPTTPIKTTDTTTNDKIDTGAPADTVTTPTTTTTTTPTTTTTTTATTAAPKSGTPGTYTVVSGDTMYSIGLKLKINWLDLAKANGLDENTANKIKIGQVLTLPKN